MPGVISGTNTAKQVCFDVSKNQEYNPTLGFRTLQKKLKNFDYKLSLHQEDFNTESLKESSLLIIANPLAKFTAKEFDNLKEYLKKGGNILYFGHQTGEKGSGSNFNFLLEEFGISVMDDSVCRSIFTKYYHPKQALVTDGIINREINRVAGKQPVVGSHQQEYAIPAQNSFMKSANASSVSLSFVYPYGCTLSVQKPSTILMSTGSTSIPFNRPVCAFAQPDLKAGKIVAVGSQMMVHDDYIEKEENMKIIDIVIKLLATDEIKLNTMDANDPEISEYYYAASTKTLYNDPRPCFEESDELSFDFNSLFVSKVYTMDVSNVPNTQALFKTFNLPQKPLSLVEPKFEAAIPSLKVATYPPILGECQAPALELFDLDEEFVSEKTRLAELTNKCTDVDLEFYIRECGRIVGITDTLQENQQTGKHILSAALRMLIQWKMLNPEMV